MVQKPVIWCRFGILGRDRGGLSLSCEYQFMCKWQWWAVSCLGFRQDTAYYLWTGMLGLLVEMKNTANWQNTAAAEVTTESYRWLTLSWKQGRKMAHSIHHRLLSRRWIYNLSTKTGCWDKEAEISRAGFNLKQAEEDEENLWQAKVFEDPSPQALLDTMIYNGVYISFAWWWFMPKEIGLKMFQNITQGG